MSADIKAGPTPTEKPADVVNGTAGEGIAPGNAGTLLGEEVKPEVVVPEKYEDFKLPDGVKVDDVMLTEFVDLAKESKLSQDSAQRVVDMAGKFSSALMAQQQQHWAEVQTGWVEGLKADPEFGGAKFDTTITEARKTLDKYGDSQLKKVLEETGLGNNDSVIRLLARVSRATAEDNTVSGSVPSTPKAPEDILFDKMK